MEGRGAWLEGNHYGDFGVLKIEVTPVLSGKIGITGALTVRYFKPTPLNQELLLQAKILSVEEHKITVGGEMWAADILIAGVFVHRMPVDIPIRFELGNIR
jgi:hypothetical protein